MFGWPTNVKDELEQKDKRFGDIKWIQHQFLVANFVNTHPTIEHSLDEQKIWSYLTIAEAYFNSIPVISSFEKGVVLKIKLNFKHSLILVPQK